MTSHGASTGFAAAVLAIVLMLVVPLPPMVLDVLLAFNILASGIVLLTSITVEQPLEFAAFAPTLLVATLFRLALDVSATRLILTQGHRPDGVGTIIPAFGAMVVGGNLVVGLIVFSILIAIQFIVIATGAQRVAEVAARFTLDAMPGKQMAIDAEIHAGVLDAESAKRKRANVQLEADFYGAMDGAGKFVKGDAVAALLIVGLNLIGGIVVGIAYHGMSPLDSLNTFALLSIGNALVTTLPAFLLSTAMGLMVTRVAANGSLGADLATQLFARPDVLRIAGGFALVLALVPALPRAVFAGLGVGLLGLAALGARRKREQQAREAGAIEATRRAAIRRPEMALGLIGVDALAIEFGGDLGSLLIAPAADALLDRVGEVRRALATEIGIVMPGVRLRDDLARDPASYGIRVRERLVAEGRLRLDAVLAVADEALLAQLAGERVREPVYGVDAVWIAPDLRDHAQTHGALVFDPVSILGSHLAEIVRGEAAELVGRQEIQTICEHLRASVPTLVKEIGTESLPLSTVQRVFERLLRERIWPRDIVATFEVLIDAATVERNPSALVEAVRRRLVPVALRARGLTELRALVVAPGFERSLIDDWTGEPALVPQPEQAFRVRAAVEAYRQTAPSGGGAIVCGSALRAALWEFLDRSGMRTDVYAYGELPAELELRPLGVLGESDAAPAPLLQ